MNFALIEKKSTLILESYLKIAGIIFFKVYFKPSDGLEIR